MQTPRRALFGALLMVTAGACFALTNVVVQYATMKMGAGSAAVVFWQYLAAAVLFLPWIFAQGRGGWRTGRPVMHVMRVVLSAIGVQFWVAGLAHVPIWQAIALILMSPFFVTLGAALILREPVGPARWLAVVLGMIGGAVILAPWSDDFTLWALMPVAAAVFWAGVSLMTKHMTATESPESLTLYLLVLLIPVNAVIWGGQGGSLDGGLIWLAVLGAGALTATAQYLLAKAYEIADAAFLQPFDHLKLLFNVGLGALVFGFVPPGRLWLGAVLIVGASAYLLERERRAGTA